LAFREAIVDGDVAAIDVTGLAQAAPGTRPADSEVPLIDAEKLFRQPGPLQPVKRHPELPPLRRRKKGPQRWAGYEPILRIRD
jgi:hypothetical protein